MSDERGEAHSSHYWKADQMITTLVSLCCLLSFKFPCTWRIVCLRSLLGTCSKRWLVDAKRGVEKSRAAMGWSL